ncbi:MAG: hypothetical protein ACK40E_00265 [Caldimicrobium sp.]
MEILSSSQELITHLENFRKILLYKRETLREISLSQFTFSFLQQLKQENEKINEILLEFILRISYAVYLKSKMLLECPQEEPEREIFWEIDSSDEEKKKLFYYQLIFTERILGEKVFLPSISANIDGNGEAEKGDINELIIAIFSLLEREKKEKSFSLKLEEKNIEDYLEEMREVLKDKKVFSWKEFLKEKKNLDLKEKIYYFLSLLFLVFNGECGIYQDEQENIQIFVKV